MHNWYFEKIGCAIRTLAAIDATFPATGRFPWWSTFDELDYMYSGLGHSAVIQNADSNYVNFLHRWNLRPWLVLLQWKWWHTAPARYMRLLNLSHWVLWPSSVNVYAYLRCCRLISALAHTGNPDAATCRFLHGPVEAPRSSCLLTRTFSMHEFFYFRVPLAPSLYFLALYFFQSGNKMSVLLLIREDEYRFSCPHWPRSFPCAYAMLFCAVASPRW